MKAALETLKAELNTVEIQLGEGNLYRNSLNEMIKASFVTTDKLQRKQDELVAAISVLETY